MVAELDEKLRKERDPLREPPLRYLGYANEVGEAFRAQVHVNIVRLSYGVATCYVIADAVHKGLETSKIRWPTDQIKVNRVRWSVVDTFIWQGLASVIIPGFTINRICALSNFLLRKTKLPTQVQKWTSTAVGLMCIPFIIKPIDRGVDMFMETSFRRLYRISPLMEGIVIHSRKE